jgi:hypothetical protein
VTSFLLGPNILLSTIFSNTLSLRSSLNINDQVSHPYRTTGKIIVLQNLKSHNPNVVCTKDSQSQNLNFLLCFLQEVTAKPVQFSWPVSRLRNGQLENRR